MGSQRGGGRRGVWCIERSLLISALLLAQFGRSSSASLSCAAVVRGLRCDPLPPPPFSTFSQPLNHTDPSSAPSFDQRYQVLTDYYKPGSPILFYAGPENAANLCTLRCLALPAWAQQMGALVVGVEHRFFGESGPDGLIAVSGSDRWEAEAKAEAKSATDPPWQFLTLENVLADYAAIAESLVGARGAYRDAKVLAFGGSYGGFLSFMLRVRYPSLFFGSLASAAPISLLGSPVIKANPGVWMDTVAAIYQSKRPQCAASVSSTLALLVDLFDQGDQFPLLQSSLSICTLPAPARRSSFLFSVAMAFSQITQFDFPWAPSADKIPFPFEAVCDRFEALPRSRADAANQTQSLAALRFALDVAYNATGSATCFRLGGSATTGAADDLHLHIESRAALSRAQPAEVGSGGGGGVDFARSWFYITCTYFVLPIRGSPSNASIFFGFNMTYSSAADDAACTYLFPNTGVKRSQSPPILPSDLSNVSRVIFSNFGNDPVLSVSMSAEDSRAVPRGVVSLVMPQAAHTQDIVAAADNEQSDVVNGRSQELSIMLQWLAAGD